MESLKQGKQNSQVTVTLNNMNNNINIKPMPHSVTLTTSANATLTTTIQIQPKSNTSFQQATVPPGLVVTKNDQGHFFLIQHSALQQNSRASIVRPIAASGSIVTNNSGQVASTMATFKPVFIQQTSLSSSTSSSANQIRPQIIQTSNSLNNSIGSPTSSSNKIQANGDASLTKEIVENVKKCKNFLSTLLKLASNQPPETLQSVRDLIQGLIDSIVTPEEFTSQLQKELKSSPQPYLIPFLKKSLPYLRQFLSNNKMQIDGIVPPKSNIISNTNINNNNSNNNNNINTTFLNQTSNNIIRQLRPNLVSIAATNSLATTTPQSQMSAVEQQLLQPQTIIANKNINNVSSANNNNIHNTLINNNLLKNNQIRSLTPQITVNTNVNTTTNISQQQQQQLQNLNNQLTGFQNSNFIAPTTPLPSQLPRLILSSNSTLLSNHQPIINNNNTSNINSKLNNIQQNRLNNNLQKNNLILQTPSSSSVLNSSSSNLSLTSNDFQHPKAEKRKYDSIRDDNDDINDVAAMGGVNLNEETRNILSASSVLVSGQLRSCKDEVFADFNSLNSLVVTIAQKKGLSVIGAECMVILSHALKEKMRSYLEQLSVVAEHRTEVYKNEKLLNVRNEVKRQLKCKQEIARIEDERVKEQESQAIMKAAKSRTKTDDPDQLKKKELAKKQQMQEMEDKRKEQSNITALAAIGPRKQRSYTSLNNSNLSSSGLSNSHTLGSGINLFNLNTGVGPGGNLTYTLTAQTLRNRMRRATLKDLLFTLQQDPRLHKSPLLYKALTKF